jgi:hypothetical protein
MPGWWVLLWSLSTAEGAGDACGAARGRAAVSGGSVARCTPARAATSLTSIPDTPLGPRPTAARRPTRQSEPIPASPSPEHPTKTSRFRVPITTRCRTSPDGHMSHISRRSTCRRRLALLVTALIDQGRRSAPTRRVSSLRCGRRRVLELHWHFHPTTPVGSKRAAASLAAILVAQGRSPQAQDPFGDCGCSAHKARNWARMKSRSSLAAFNIRPNRFRSPSASSRSCMPFRRSLYASLANSRALLA